jgi:hypothetical protein
VVSPRQGALVRRSRIEPPNAFLASHLIRPFVLLLVDSPVDLRIAIGLARRVVLIHEVHIGIGRDLAAKKSHDLASSRDAARHNQVPHQEAAARQPLLIEYQISHLNVHLLQSFPRRLRIILRLRIATGNLRVPVLEVGHIDVYDAGQETEAFQGVIAAGVVDEGHPEASLDGNGECLEDLGHDVLGRHEVDVVTPLPLELEHHLR